MMDTSIVQDYEVEPEFDFCNLILYSLYVQTV
ncbi:hypothetical protein QOZ95_004668 [Paenibacillus brasilensis]|uniref:Uncharacterized protein n=1 Tax=Paenibacillus brasilensis TaxID=128574 RepID=A0ABU0L594_9BACL|nr:hypothetical protein [Paenibacillus brasilensis]